MKLAIRKVCFVLFLENVKCFGAINKDASTDSLTVARLKGIHPRMKTFMFPIKLIPT